MRANILLLLLSLAVGTSQAAWFSDEDATKGKIINIQVYGFRA
jgi:hypothetical protein